MQRLTYPNILSSGEVILERSLNYISTELGRTAYADHSGLNMSLGGRSFVYCPN